MILLLNQYYSHTYATKNKKFWIFKIWSFPCAPLADVHGPPVSLPLLGRGPPVELVPAPSGECCLTLVTGCHLPVMSCLSDSVLNGISINS